MITVLHRGGYAQMITILHRGGEGGSLGSPKSDYVICARPLRDKILGTRTFVCEEQFKTTQKKSTTELNTQLGL